MDGRQPGGPAAGDAVVGVFDRDRLSGALVATHRAGFGPHARVLDGARGDLAGQLRRAGIPLTVGGAGEETDTALVVVTAPGRAATAAETLARAGARAVHRLTRGAPAPALPDHAPSPVLPPGAVTPGRQDDAPA